PPPRFPFFLSIPLSCLHRTLPNPLLHSPPPPRRRLLSICTPAFPSPCSSLPSGQWDGEGSRQVRGHVGEDGLIDPLQAQGIRAGQDLPTSGMDGRSKATLSGGGSGVRSKAVHGHEADRRGRKRRHQQHFQVPFPSLDYILIPSPVPSPVSNTEEQERPSRRSAPSRSRRGPLGGTAARGAADLGRHGISCACCSSSGTLAPLILIVYSPRSGGLEYVKSECWCGCHC
ncbi:unnamed protein product, partial [Urochloa humidicola]